MENSKTKQFTSFKLRTTLSSVMKSPDVPLCPPPPDVSHSSVLCDHAVCTTHPRVPGKASGLSDWEHRGCMRFSTILGFMYPLQMREEYRTTNAQETGFVKMFSFNACLVSKY